MIERRGNIFGSKNGRGSENCQGQSSDGLREEFNQKMDDVGTAGAEVGTTVGSGTEMSVEGETTGIEIPVGRAGTEGKTEENEGRAWEMLSSMRDGKTVEAGRDIAGPRLGRPLGKKPGMPLGKTPGMPFGTPGRTAG